METAPKITRQALQEFCYKPGRKADHPFANRGRIIATDGRILVACDPSAIEDPLAAWPEDGFEISKINFPFDHDALAGIEWINVPSVVVAYLPCTECEGIGKKRVCPKCEGDGEIFSDCPCCNQERQERCSECLGIGYTENSPEVECEECEGAGKVVDHSKNSIMIGEETLNVVYLDKIARLLPEAKIEARQQRLLDPVRFKFRGGLGYLMPMRK